jgi:hypothetical protein
MSLLDVHLGQEIKYMMGNDELAPTGKESSPMSCFQPAGRLSPYIL